MATNVCIALLFAGSFGVLATIFRGRRQATWFAVAYAVGALTPLSEILVRITHHSTLFSAISYGSSLAALLLIGMGFARFRGVSFEFGVPLIIFVAGMVLRAAIWGGERSTFPYELWFQLPHVFACVWTASLMARIRGSTTLDRVVSSYFGLMAAYFLAKAFLSVTFGSGMTAQAYAASTYALLSQASGAVMMLGVAVLILFTVVKDVTDRSRQEAETDALTGIANRRGFDRGAELVFCRAAETGSRVSVALFDLDHFKNINDAHGHNIGDEVICGFAAILRRCAPSSALIARTGGEEFAMLLEKADVEQCRLSAEVVRVAVLAERQAGLPVISVSGGIAERRDGELLPDLLRRADQALYHAKRGGRNKVAIAAGELHPVSRTPG